MNRKSVLKVLLGLLNRGSGADDDTSLFADLPHEAVIQKFVGYLNAHRHFVGICHIEPSHALNDKGVDILVTGADFKVGFQLKSHFDVTEGAFAANVKRQWAESHAHGLDHYFILICSPLKFGQKDYGHKISHLLSELSQMKTTSLTAFGPRNTVRFFSGLPAVTREELLLHRAISEDCLHECEKGYEHLPEVTDPEVTASEKHFDSFGDDWSDSDEVQAAFERLQQLTQAKQAEQFRDSFLPTLPPDVRSRRDDLVVTALGHLAECRRCESWCDRSEYKLPQWLDGVPEAMIPYTSLPNLLRITADLQRYLEIHREEDTSLMPEGCEGTPLDEVSEAT